MVLKVWHVIYIYQLLAMFYPLAKHLEAWTV